MNVLPTAVIFDVDGTLCDVRSIKHLVSGEPRNFAAFFPLTLSCPPHQAVLDLVPLARAAGHVPLVVTARSEVHRDVTEQWLQLHGVIHDGLFMRADDPDHLLPDDVAKEATLERILTRYRPVHAIEDNPTVVALWRRYGIDVTVVPGFSGEIGTGPVVIDNPFQNHLSSTVVPPAVIHHRRGLV